MNNTVTMQSTATQDWQAASAIFNGTYTLVGPRGRRTIEVETVKPGRNGISPFVSKFLGQRVVKLLVGPDNTTDFRMIGWLKPGDSFKATQANVGTDMEKIGAAFVQIVTKGIDGYTYQMSTTCRRCGRKLTVPSSIDAGLGPDCADKGAFSL
jgi:cytochrome c556